MKNTTPRETGLKKVCAHIQLGPFNREHKRFNCIHEALTYFMREVAGTDFGTGTEGQCMAMSPQCDECTDDMNFHGDELALWYKVTKKGNVKRKGWM